MEFCTLFDHRYLARGLVLYRSLKTVCPDARLRVFCMDDDTKRLLDDMRLPELTAISLQELESHDPELRATKSTRTQVEYCWTATPAVCLHALETDPELEMITYLDADLMFFHDPGPIFDELGEDSVLIIPHRYEARWSERERKYGTYNVQFMTFRRTRDGLAALRWWRGRCIEWCYARFEDGKFGDQRYLDDWPERFPSVHVLEHPGGGVAPWNVGGSELELRGSTINVDGQPLIFYHYHSLQIYRVNMAFGQVRHLSQKYRFTPTPTPLIWTTGYPISTREDELVWELYLRQLSKAIDDISRLNPTCKSMYFGEGELAIRAMRSLLRRRPTIRTSLRKKKQRE